MPITVAPVIRRPAPTSALLAIHSAKPDTAMEMASETSVMPMSYDSGTGSEKASMPMKCIDQMPQPMAAAPPTIHNLGEEPFARATRDARLRAV